MFVSTTEPPEIEEARFARPGESNSRSALSNADDGGRVHVGWRSPVSMTCSKLAERHRVWVLPLLVMLSSAPACKRAPRYVFVDGGAHTGETVREFERSQLFKKHPWKVVSFEPNPDLVPQIPQRPFLTVRSEALWNADTDLEFHVSRYLTLGGSAMPTFVPQDEMKTIKVKAIDFGQWLKNNYRKEDVVFVKMDIEGAEYPVLEKMLKDGSMTYVDRLYIEFHGAQQVVARGRPAEELRQTQIKDSQLIEAITGLGIAVSIHLPEEAQGDYFNFNPEDYGQRW